MQPPRGGGLSAKQPLGRIREPPKGNAALDRLQQAAMLTSPSGSNARDAASRGLSRALVVEGFGDFAVEVA
jgi:hypothetical protein